MPLRKCLILVGLFLISLLIRIPNLYTSPGFYEGNELSVTLDLVHGVKFPLYNQNPHIGAFSNYIVACFFWIFGVHWWVPRLASLIAGAVTVPLVFALGRRMFSAPTGFLAAILFSFCSFHVLFLSHVPWSNNFTPLFSIASTLCFYNATKMGGRLWFLLGGLFFGIGLQTHPSVITLLIPILGFILFSKDIPARVTFRSSGPYLSILGAAAGYINMLFYNIQNRMQSVTFGLTHPTYALQSDSNITTYVRNLKSAVALLLRLVSGGVEVKRIHPVTWTVVAVVVSAALILAGLFVCLRNRQWELPVLFIVPLLAIPAVNKAYEVCQFGRYMGLLLAPAFLLIAVFIIWVFETIRKTRFRMLAYTSAFIPIFMLATHFDQYKKLSTELERQNPSMVIFSKATSILNRSEKTRKPILIDANAWKSRTLSIFLQTDGWNASILPGSLSQKEMRRKELSAENGRIRIKTINSVVIASPKLTPYLLKNQRTERCAGCLVKVKMKGGSVQKKLSNAIYVFLDVADRPVGLLPNSEVFILRSYLKNPDAANPKLISNAKQFFRNCEALSFNFTHKRNSICGPEHNRMNKGSRRVRAVNR